MRIKTSINDLMEIEEFEAEFNSNFDGINELSVDGIGYGELRVSDRIRYHHAWYSTFLDRGLLELSLFNIEQEYGLMLKMIKEKHI
jgi:hypothetical protein